MGLKESSEVEEVTGDRCLPGGLYGKPLDGMGHGRRAVTWWA